MTIYFTFKPMTFTKIDRDNYQVNEIDYKIRRFGGSIWKVIDQCGKTVGNYDTLRDAKQEAVFHWEFINQDQFRA